MAGSDLQQAIRSLADAPARTTVSAPKEQAPIRDSAGRAPNGIAANGGGGDLSEQSFANRTYHARQTLKSTDGLITWLFEPIKTVKMTDASGNSVVLSFAEPTT